MVDAYRLLIQRDGRWTASGPLVEAGDDALDGHARRRLRDGIALIEIDLERGVSLRQVGAEARPNDDHRVTISQTQRLEFRVGRSQSRP